MTCKKSFAECEMDILKLSISEAEQYQHIQITDEIKEMLYILEDHLRSPDYICYGGTAINDILPKKDRFYDYEHEIPDYDVFCKNALFHVKELADKFHNKGYKNILAKSGVHVGTYKLYVNKIQLLDITQLDPVIYDHIYPECIKISGIHYAPPNFLRQSMYLELSSPAGETKRWEKVLTRLNLLNKHYPLESPKECSSDKETKDIKDRKVYNIIKKELIDQEVVFIGAYADSLYSKFMPKNKKVKYITEFDVLSKDPFKTVNILKKTLEMEDIKNIKIIKHKQVGEIIKDHYELKMGKESLCFIYEPFACHSYNEIMIDDDKIKIGSIDTLLTFYLMFIYIGRSYYDLNRILCISHLLFNLQQNHRLDQNGILKRFTISCYGNQHSINDIFDHKSEMYEKLKNKKYSKEYDTYFLKYNPENKREDKYEHKTKKISKNFKKKSKKKYLKYFNMI
jgi:hypothetical protein